MVFNALTGWELWYILIDETYLYNSFGQFISEFKYFIFGSRTRRKNSDFNYFLSELYKEFIKRIIPQVYKDLLMKDISEKDKHTIFTFVNQLDSIFLTNKIITSLAMWIIAESSELSLSDVLLPSHKKSVLRKYTSSYQDLRQYKPHTGLLPSRTVFQFTNPSKNVQLTFTKRDWHFKDKIKERYHFLLSILDISDTVFDSAIDSLLQLRLFTKKEKSLKFPSAISSDDFTLIFKILSVYELNLFVQGNYIRNDKILLIKNYIITSYPGTNWKPISFRNTITFHQLKIIRLLFQEF